MNLNDLRVRRGDPIQPAWQRLLKWAAGTKLIAGRGVRLSVTPQGTLVTADVRNRPWDHPWKVAVSDKTASIRPGLLNNLMPTIKGVALDGKDAKAPPTLKIAGGPDEELRSWVMLQVTMDADGRIPPKAKDAITLIHVNQLEPELPVTTGLQPLALLQWDESGSVKSVFQIAHHNLNHRFLPGIASRGPGRHFFWAV